MSYEGVVERLPLKLFEVEKMKKNCLTFALALVAVLAVLCSPTVVSAAENESYTYSINCTSEFVNSNDKTDIYSYTMTTPYPLYGYLSEPYVDSRGTIYTLYVIMVGDSDVNSQSMYIKRLGQIDRTKSNGEKVIISPITDALIGVDTCENWIARLSSGQLGSYINSAMVSWNVDFPLFGDKKSLIAYLQSGDDSGQLNKPKVDYSVSHDFSKDYYSSAIPVPAITNVTYNGFELTNWESGYYVDIVLESYLNGVKINNRSEETLLGTGEYYPYYDDSWVLNNHYYDFTLSDMAVSQADINILDLYGIDNEGLLIEDFKTWSVDYPKVTKLPSYSFLKYSTELVFYYERNHVYDGTIETSAGEQLKRSGQGLVVFYIRYYTQDMQYGQWVKYTVRPSYLLHGSSLSGKVVVESVDIDYNGNVHENQVASGKVNESGGVSYGSTSSGADTDTSLQGFMDTLDAFGESTQKVSGFVSSIFGFLPWWSTALLGLAVAAVVVLRFLGR